MDIDYIERLTAAYALKRKLLGSSVETLQADIDKARKAHLPRIRHNVAQTAAAKAKLQAAVEDRPDLFARPKTRIFHGIRVGFVKGKGKVVFAKAERVVALIRKHMPDSFETLVKVEEKPQKTALGKLSVAELKKIGCTVTDTTDQAVVAPVDSEIDKLVDALLDAAETKEGGG